MTECSWNTSSFCLIIISVFARNVDCDIFLFLILWIMVSGLMKLNCWNVCITKTQPYDFALTLTALEVDVKNLHELCGDFCNTNICCFGYLFCHLLQTLHHPRKIEVSIYYFCLRTESTIEFFSTFLCIVHLYSLTDTGCFSQSFQQHFFHGYFSKWEEVQHGAPQVQFLDHYCF